MRLKKVLIVILTLSMCNINKINAQLSLGAQGTFGAFTGGVGLLKGFGIEGGYGLLHGRKGNTGSKLFLCGSFNYYGGGKGSGSFDANALSSLNPLQSITVPYTWTLHMLQFNIGAKYYVAGNMDAPFSFYTQLGLTIEDMPVVYNVSSYDQTSYDNSQAPTNSNNVGIAFHLGLGIDVKAGPVHPYLATRLIIPANTVNGQSIDIVIPFAAVVDLGVRIPIGGDK